jgi:hypothetical protein
VLGFSTCPSCSRPCARLVLFLGLCVCFPFAAAESRPYSVLTAQLQGSLCILPEGLGHAVWQATLQRSAVVGSLAAMWAFGCSVCVLAQVGSLSKQLSFLH